jgi:hypothetical protein
MPSSLRSPINFASDLYPFAARMIFSSKCVLRVSVILIYRCYADSFQRSFL